MFKLPAAPGVTCVFAADTAAAADALARHAETADGLRLVRGIVPAAGDLPAAFAGVLADAAALTWPDWGGDGDPADPARPAALAAKRVAAATGGDAAWLAAAVAAARAGREPRPGGFGNAAQVRNLVAVLGAGGGRVAVAVNVEPAPPDPPPGSLLPLSRASEWLARTAGVRVFALLPDRWADRADLDGVNPGAVRFDAPPPIAGPSNGAADEPRRRAVTPLLGRPHPGSPGELALAAFLSGDDELAGLFRFNAAVRTARGSRFVVDLLWAAGRVVVEVDGYGWHSSPAAFAADRARDHELTLTGYLVLRLPHDFVVADPALAAERVRDLVRFRRRHPPPPAGAFGV